MSWHFIHSKTIIPRSDNNNDFIITEKNGFLKCLHIRVPPETNTLLCCQNERTVSVVEKLWLMSFDNYNYYDEKNLTKC